MPFSYKITEPHPSLFKSSSSQSSAYIPSGRGGAGNFAHYHASSITSGIDAHGPASRITLNHPSSSSSSSSSSSHKSSSSSNSAYYSSGRGGAGNLSKQYHERAIFSFDEELARQSKMMENQAPMYHVGRGGAGNYVDECAAMASATTVSALGLGSGSTHARQTSISGTSSTGSMRSDHGSVLSTTTSSTTGGGGVRGTLNKLRGSFSRN